MSCLNQINPHVAGIDIGSKSHFVAAPVTKEGVTQIEVREISVLTPDLCGLVDWLKQCNVRSVAMESTGVYWIPIFEMLEDHGFEVYLVDARQLKSVAGRHKTDVEDCRWIQKLHSYGLLKAAFRPANNFLPLRSYTRQRDTLISNAAQNIQRMQKALTQMNIHLANVVSHINGKTGMTIIRAIVAGQHDPKILASYRDPHCKKSQQDIEKALTGNYREEHLFSLEQALEAYDFIQSQVIKCDKRIADALETLNPSLSEKPRKTENEDITPKKRKPKDGNALHFDITQDLQDVTKVDLTKIPGISSNLAVKILSEIGTDMDKWPTSGHFVSWLALSPENKISGGKRLSSRTKPSASRAAAFFRMAAMTIMKTKTALGAFFRRIQAKRGTAKAITATARKIAIIFYSMLHKKQEFNELGAQYYEDQYKTRLLKNMQKRAADLGYSLIPTQHQAA